MEQAEVMRTQPPADLRENFAWVREDTFTGLLVSVGALLWFWILLYLGDPFHVWPGWGTLLAAFTLDVVCFAMRRSHYYRSAWLFVFGLFIGAVSFSLAPSPLPIAPFLFVPIVLIAGTLLGSRPGFLFGTLASVPLFFDAFRGQGPATVDITASAFAIMWLTLFASWATTRNLYTTLDWSWSASMRAEENLREARIYQGRLAAVVHQVEDANYRLEQANQALDWARAEAERARQLKAQFAAHVSHELRTPINLVVGFAELMLNTPEAYGGVALPDTYLADLSALSRSARHLRALVDDILDLSQIDAGEMPLIRDITEINAVVQEAVATARSLLDRKGLRLDVQLCPDLPMLNVDRLRIRQVLLNLLNNAARYTDAGSVTVRTFRDRDNVRIEVTDTGTGIRPADLQRLFEAYHQADSSITRGRGGTGLGLAIAKRFVELHGGRIWATSDGLGRGSTFTISLPLHAADTLLPDQDGPSTILERVRTSAHSAPTIVVVDDDPAVAGLLRRYLSGYQVTGTASESEALRLSESIPVHAVVTDLPGPENLDDWYQHWLEITRDHAIRVIGCPMPSGRRLARVMGLADYLVKPVTRETLLETITQLGKPVRTVLVVDDQPPMVKLLCRMLRAAPGRYRLLRAHSGAEALAMARRWRPDLVLLDLLMPEVDGLTVLERLKDDPALRTIPVIAVSARGAFEAISPSTSRAIALINDQPFTISRLLRTVQQTLDTLQPAIPLTSCSPEATPAAVDE
ncbi:MAG TPA: ATP-binding protein [Chloroflexota bacterium]|nr:ATP-binding protein [Chloroflexota bacterium]